MSAFGLDPSMTTGFLDEAGQCLSTLNERLLSIESGHTAKDVIHDMFRAAHSMKGSAGFLELNDISELTHHLETVLDHCRRDECPFSAAVIDSLFTAFDTLSALMADIAADTPGTVDIAPAVLALDTALKASMGGASDEGEGDTQPETQADETVGTIPPWLDAVLDEEDHCEAIVADAAGQHIFGLRFGAREVARNLEELGLVLDALWRRVKLQRVATEVIGDGQSWTPLVQHDLTVVIYGFSDDDVLGGLEAAGIPTDDLWICRDEAWTQLTGEMQLSGDALSIKPELERHRSDWIACTAEELEELESTLIAMEGCGCKGEDLDRVMLLFHRLKGSSGTMGLTLMTRIAHLAESLVDRADISGNCQKIIELLVRARDLLAACLSAIRNGTPTPQDVGPYIAACNRMLANAETKMPDGWVALAQTVRGPLHLIQATVAVDTHMPDLRLGMIYYNVAEVAEEIVAAQPTQDQLESGEAAESREIILLVRGDGEEVRAAALVDQLSRLSVEPVHVQPVNNTVSVMPDTAAVDDATGGGPAAAVHMPADTLRIEASRLDEMLNVTGELVITKARVSRLADNLGRGFDMLDLRVLEELVAGAAVAGQTAADTLHRARTCLESLGALQTLGGELSEAAGHLHRHVGGIQSSVMRARLVPVGPLFNRFHRLVRDLSKGGERQARLVTSGETTELDKKLIDELADPLTHLIRNAVDHGLEPTSQRSAAGKDPSGTVFLDAFHEGGQICIRIRDDGRGIDRDKVLKRAVERGLVTQEAGERLEEEEVFQLIFTPGFSTAEKVTDISGRGVGMDIVRSRIAELKGVIHIDSTPGQGTTFTIRLPLTLAMIRGLLVRIGQGRFAFPLESIREIIEMPIDTVRCVEGRHRMIDLRGKVVPLLDLSELMDADPLSHDESGVVRAVITKGSGQALAIAVDRVLGDEEVVVKRLPEGCDTAKGLAGATVLGDGGLALILDVAAIGGLARDHAVPVGG